MRFHTLVWIVWFAILSSCTISCGSDRECSGTIEYLSGLNVGEFAGCTHVLGNVVLNQMSLEGDMIADIPPISLEDLTHLSNILEISGYLLIQNLNHDNLTDLRFLHNLVVIHGQETVELRPGHNYSLIVEDNQYLQTLNLASLQEIVNGGVRISNNPQLCLVDTITVEDYLVNSDLSRVGGLALDCASRDVQCHAECVGTRGCWGTLPDECVECRNYVYRGTCVPQCNVSISYVNETTLECIPFWNGNPTTTTIITGMESSPALSVLQPSTVQASHHSVMTTQTIAVASLTEATLNTSIVTPSTGPATTAAVRPSSNEYGQTSLNTLVTSSDSSTVTTSEDGKESTALSTTTTVLETESPSESFEDTNNNSGISTWIVAVCVVVGTILITIAIILMVVVPCTYHSKKTKTALVQRGRRSPKKYSEDPELVQLLKVSQNDPSPHPARQRITMGSLAQDNHHLESRHDHMISTGSHVTLENDHVISTSKSHGSHVTLEHDHVISTSNSHGSHVISEHDRVTSTSKSHGSHVTSEHDHVISTSKSHGSHVTLEGDHVTNSQRHTHPPPKRPTPSPTTSPTHISITPTQSPTHSSSPPPIFHKHMNEAPHRGHGHRSPYHHGYSRSVGGIQQRSFGTGVYSTRTRQPTPTPYPHRGSSITPSSSHTSTRPSRTSWTTSLGSNGRTMVSTHASLTSLQDYPHH